MDRACWLVRLNGKITLPFIYDQIYLSRKDRLTVQLNGLWGIIDQQGNTFLELKYDQISQIGLGYIVKENGLYGMLNLDFEVVLPLEYDYVDNILLHSGYDSYGTYSNILYLIKRPVYTAFLISIKESSLNHSTAMLSHVGKIFIATLTFAPLRFLIL
ncbi:MAG: WG repeat-containing protein [Bacteroidetes bacterium]|nr:WG repeat-containing protein [Bacteroidota bacterium]